VHSLPFSLSVSRAAAAAPSHRPRRTGCSHGWQASCRFGGELTLPGFDGRAGIRKWRGPLLALGLLDDARQARVRAAVGRFLERVLD